MTSEQCEVCMVFGVIYVQFSTLSFNKFCFSEISYFWVIFSTLCADFQSEFSTPHPGPKAILGHCWWSRRDVIGV